MRLDSISFPPRTFLFSSFSSSSSFLFDCDVVCVCVSVSFMYHSQLMFFDGRIISFFIRGTYNGASHFFYLIFLLFLNFIIALQQRHNNHGRFGKVSVPSSEFVVRCYLSSFFWPGKGIMLIILPFFYKVILFNRRECSLVH